MTEQYRQSKISSRLKKEGWLVVKLMKTTMNGIPDLMCLRNGIVFFVEVKTPKGILSELQKYTISELQKQGFETKIWTDYETDY